MNSKKHTRYCYRAYGLEIHSAIRLSEMVPTEEQRADVCIRLGRLDEPFLNAELDGGITRSGGGVHARASVKAVTFHWRGVGKALVRSGRDVIVEPEAGVNEEDLPPYINGSILAVLLHQRRLMVLHASAVVIDGKAVAFMGDKGAGKSTIAASMQRQGYTVLADDLVPINFIGGKISTIPGFPRISLWPDSVERIGLDPRTIPTINRYVKKHSYQPPNFSTEPLELRCLIALADEDDVRIEQLRKTESFIEIVRNCYLGRYVEATGQTVNHFENCATLAVSVPVLRLGRPLDFSILPEVSSLVEMHCRSFDSKQSVE